MKTALNMINGPLAKWLPLGLTAVLACGCNSVYMNFDYDDVYGHAPSRNQERQMLSKAARGQSDAQSVENAYYYDEETGEYYLYENDTAAYEYPAFDYDNYYDYEYSSRLKRFHQDDYITDDYYDDYYTNTYWYDQNPYSYGTSIYLGYNNWVPSFTVYGGGWSLGLSYGYDPFWYRSYRYWPSYSYWDWGWPGYWGPGYWHGWGWGSGYWNGYWDGYHDGFWGNHWACNDYFYNSFDKNTYYKQEIRRGHSNAGSGSGGNSQPLVVRRGGSTTGGTGGAAGITTGTGSLRGSGTGGTGGTGSSSQRRVSPSFGERYQAAVRQEQRVSADKDGNLRNNGGVSTNPVRPTQRTSNGQTVRTQTGASGTVRLNESVGKENSTTAPQRTVSPTTPQRTTAPQRATTAPQRTVNPNTPQRTTRTNSYTTPSYNNGSRNGSSYYSPQYQRQTTTNSYYRSNQSNTQNRQPVTAPARQSAPAYKPTAPARQTTTSVRTTTSTQTRSTYSTGSGSSSGSRSSGGSSGGNSGGGNTRRR